MSKGSLPHSSTVRRRTTNSGSTTYAEECAHINDHSTTHPISSDAKVLNEVSQCPAVPHAVAQGVGVRGVFGVDVSEAGGVSGVDGGRGLLGPTSDEDDGTVSTNKSVSSIAVQTEPLPPHEAAVFSLCEASSSCSVSSSGVSSDEIEEKREVDEEDPPRSLAECLTIMKSHVSSEFHKLQCEVYTPYLLCTTLPLTTQQ